MVLHPHKRGSKYDDTLAIEIRSYFFCRVPVAGRNKNVSFSPFFGTLLVKTELENLFCFSRMVLLLYVKGKTHFAVTQVSAYFEPRL